MIRIDKKSILRTENPCVGGSIPPGPTETEALYTLCEGFFVLKNGDGQDEANRTGVIGELNIETEDFLDLTEKIKIFAQNYD